MIINKSKNINKEKKNMAFIVYKVKDNLDKIVNN